MKKTMLFVAACLLSLAANAQVLEVVSMQKLPIAAQADMKVAGVSPAGDYILLTTGSNQGLQRYDLESQTLTILSEAAGAGYNVQVSNDGKEVVYRETSLNRSNLRESKFVRMNMYNERRNTIARGQRDMKHMSTSDNLTKLCYYVCGNGCWVSNIDGSNPQYIGHKCQAAKWYDNNTLVAMATYDDGHFTTASSIVLYTLDGKKQVLTNDSMIAMYPYATKNAIVFSTIEGETYLLNVK